VTESRFDKEKYGRFFKNLTEYSPFEYQVRVAMILCSRKNAILGSETRDALPHGFTHPGDDPNIRANTYGVTNFLDDFGEDAFKDKKLFERISTYGKGPAPVLGKHRILVPTLLPYRLERSSRGFRHYRRIGGGG